MVQRVELKTERLLLRPFRIGDEPDVLAHCEDPEFGRFLPLLPWPYTGRDAEEFVVERIAESWETRPYFAIVVDGKVVGGIDLQVQPALKRAGLGYGIASWCWGNGLTVEAARAVVEWGFEVFPLDRVFATADARNQQSWRVMEKLGMRREGLLRAHRLTRGERSDEVVYGVLREEWLTHA